MLPAFAGFQDPHAWLIRGLVQNNWPDITRQPGSVPPGHFGGFDLSLFSSSNGREGVILHVPAVADGQWLEEDGVYAISCKITRMAEGGFGVALRCPDANYLEEFPFDQGNPLETLELIQRALTAYIPDFVRWRFGGGEVPWSQRAGTPEVRGESCSAALHLFVRQRVSTYQSFDNGPAENWWSASNGPTGTPNAFTGGPVAITGNAGKTVDVVSQHPVNIAGQQAQEALKKPGYALSLGVSLGMLNGLVWVGNGLYTLISFFSGDLANDFGDYLPALFFSVIFGTGYLVLGAVAQVGASRYRQAQKHPLVWVAIGYCLLPSFCCMATFPISGWAVWAAQKDVVKRAQNER